MAVGGGWCSPTLWALLFHYVNPKSPCFLTPWDRCVAAPLTIFFPFFSFIFFPVPRSENSRYKGQSWMACCPTAPASDSASPPCQLGDHMRETELFNSKLLIAQAFLHGTRSLSAQTGKRCPTDQADQLPLHFLYQPPAVWPQSCTVHLWWEQRDLLAICTRQSSHLAAIRLPTNLSHLQLYNGS